MKYIIVADDFGNPTPIIFPETLTHVEVAGRLKVLSAGFCSIGDFIVVVWGESISLNIVSHPDDAKLIEKHIK